MPKSKKGLAKRFQPLLRQAETEGQLRYGAQEQGLQSLFDDTTRGYERQSGAQDAAARSLLGSLQSAGVNLNQAYTDAGLTPELRAQIANSPDGQRIAASLARGQADIQNQTSGAQAGRMYLQSRLADDYRSDVGKINSQRQAMTSERGLFESSLLDQLIGSDRAARSKINADARAQDFDAAQAIQQQDAARDNALITQGLLPGADGTLQPLPGGKADPNAPGNKPKPKPRAKATPEQMQGAVGQFGSALAAIGTLDPDRDRSNRREIGQTLLAGAKSQKIYETVEVEDRYGQKTRKRRQKVSKGGTPLTTPAIPKTQQVLATAALDMYYDGHLSPSTVKQLHKLGYEVRAFPGVKTRADMPKRPKTYEERIRANEVAGPPAPRG